jgi:hypothetical protein
MINLVRIKITPLIYEIIIYYIVFVSFRTLSKINTTFDEWLIVMTSCKQFGKGTLPGG